MKLIRKTGTEGPQHDPYSWEELIVLEKDTIVTYHRGLYTYIKLEKTPDRLVEKYEEDEKTLDRYFTTMTGLTPKLFYKCVQRIEFPDSCPKCGHKKMNWFEGYPGEDIRQCANCKAVTGYSFNESAIL